MTRSVEVSAPFLTWRHGTAVFLAARDGDGHVICDDAGNYYGGWQSVETFRKRQRTGNGDCSPLMGRAAITVRSLP